MYIVIDPVGIKPTANEEEQVQHFLAIKQRIAQQFPGNGKLFSVTESEDGETLLYIDQWGPLDRTQEVWLNTSPDIDQWSSKRGGSLVLSGKTPTIATYPCRFDSRSDTREAHLDLTQRLGAYLRLRDRCCGPESVTAKPLCDEVLHVLLRQADIPLEGWTQTLWFCEWCDQPGATESDYLCLSCQAAQHRLQQEVQQPGRKLLSTLLLLATLSMLLLQSILRGRRDRRT